MNIIDFSSSLPIILKNILSFILKNDELNKILTEKNILEIEKSINSINKFISNFDRSKGIGNLFRRGSFKNFISKNTNKYKNNSNNYFDKVNYFSDDIYLSNDFINRNSFLYLNKSQYKILIGVRNSIISKNTTFLEKFKLLKPIYYTHAIIAFVKNILIEIENEFKNKLKTDTIESIDLTIFSIFQIEKVFVELYKILVNDIQLVEENKYLIKSLNEIIVDIDKTIYNLKIHKKYIIIGNIFQKLNISDYKKKIFLIENINFKEKISNLELLSFRKVFSSNELVDLFNVEINRIVELKNKIFNLPFDNNFIILIEYDFKIYLNLMTRFFRESKFIYKNEYKIVLSHILSKTFSVTNIEKIKNFKLLLDKIIFYKFKEADAKSIFNFILNNFPRSFCKDNDNCHLESTSSTLPKNSNENLLQYKLNLYFLIFLRNIALESFKEYFHNYLFEEIPLNIGENDENNFEIIETIKKNYLQIIKLFGYFLFRFVYILQKFLKKIY